MNISAAVISAGIAGKIFLGQAYPSGNAYLLPFTKEGEKQAQYNNKPALKNWPSNVTLHCLYSEGCLDKEVGRLPRKARRAAYFVPELEKRIDEKTDSSKIIFDSIPGREGLEDEERSKECGLNYKKSSLFRYVGSGDFFDLQLFECGGYDLIVRYNYSQATKTAAYQTLAVDPELRLVDLKYSEGAQKRLLSSAEEKAELLKGKKDESDCTTVPASLKNARVILKAKLQKTGESIRLSMYDDPGCGGHLTRIYILDIGVGEKFTQKYFLHRYLGGI